MLTYHELLRHLLNLNDDQLAMYVAVKQDYGEYIPVERFEITTLDPGEQAEVEDQLDSGHPVIVCND